MKLCPRAWSEELVVLIISSVLGYYGFPRWCKLQPSSLPPVFQSPILEGFLHYIPSFSWSWPSICWSCRSLLDCLSHLPSSQIFCKLQQLRQYCSGVISLLMRPDCKLWAFNAEMTTSPRIALPPCSHGWPTVLVLFSWDALGGCL